MDIDPVVFHTFPLGKGGWGGGRTTMHTAAESLLISLHLQTPSQLGLVQRTFEA